MDRLAVYVDLSAKVEQWDKPTAIAASNDHQRVILVSPDIKRRANLMLQGGEPAQMVLMAAFAYLAVRPLLASGTRVVLDQDYIGAAAHRIIVRRLVELIRSDLPGFRASRVRIERVAGSRADRLARQTFIGERQPDLVVTWEELERVLWQANRPGFPLSA